MTAWRKRRRAVRPPGRRQFSLRFGAEAVCATAVPLTGGGRHDASRILHPPSLMLGRDHSAHGPTAALPQTSPSFPSGTLSCTPYCQGSALLPNRTPSLLKNGASSGAVRPRRCVSSRSAQAGRPCGSIRSNRPRCPAVGAGCGQSGLGGSRARIRRGDPCCGGLATLALRQHGGARCYAI
jgi:hypothetical protein